MKISETTSFPHPVLAPWSTDIEGSVFSTTITFQEEPDRSQVSIHCNTTLSQPEILKLIDEGAATFGCYLRCQDTGLRRLQSFGFPVGVHHFAPGHLLGHVHLRPMVWSTRLIPSYMPTGMHPEYTAPFSLSAGQILALDDEQIIEVTRPPLPSVESIFEMISSMDVSEGDFHIDSHADKIIVRMGEKTYRQMQLLRSEDDVTRSVVMNAVYVPVVMQVLEQLSQDGFASFEHYRWLQAFQARCEQCGVDVDSPNLFSDAQKLLERPFASLKSLVEDEDANDAAAT